MWFDRETVVDRLSMIGEGQDGGICGLFGHGNFTAWHRISIWLYFCETLDEDGWRHGFRVAGLVLA